MPSNRMELMDPLFLAVFRDVRRLRAGRAPAVGIAGNLDSRDHLLQRPGEDSGRYGRGDSRPVSGAQTDARCRNSSTGRPRPKTGITAVGTSMDGKWEHGHWVVADKSQGSSATPPISRRCRVDCVPLLGSLPGYAGSGVAARPRLPDDQGSGRILPQFPELQEGIRRQVSHLSRQQRRI